MKRGPGRPKNRVSPPQKFTDEERKIIETFLFYMSFEIESLLEYASQAYQRNPSDVRLREMHTFAKAQHAALQMMATRVQHRFKQIRLVDGVRVHCYLGDGKT